MKLSNNTPEGVPTANCPCMPHRRLLHYPSLVRLWWNWQTRYFEVVVGQPVQVQVLLSAPIFIFISSRMKSPWPALVLALIVCPGCATCYRVTFNNGNYVVTQGKPHLDKGKNRY